MNVYSKGALASVSDIHFASLIAFCQYAFVSLLFCITFIKNCFISFIIVIICIVFNYPKIGRNFPFT